MSCALLALAGAIFIKSSSYLGLFVLGTKLNGRHAMKMAGLGEL